MKLFHNDVITSHVLFCALTPRPGGHRVTIPVCNLLPSAYEARREGHVFRGVCLLTDEGLPCHGQGVPVSWLGLPLS